MVGVSLSHLPGLNTGLNRLKRVSTFLHVPLDLPRELNLIANIQIKAEIKQIPDPRIVHGVEALYDDDGGGLDSFGGVEGAVDVVVDGLGDCLAVLQVAEHLLLLLLGVRERNVGRSS